MKLKNIYEELSSPIAKEKYRKLVKKYHPDMPQGNQNVVRKINNAKDAGDKELLTLYQKLTGKKVDIPINIKHLREAQHIWAKDIKGNKEYQIREIYPKLLKNNSIEIDIIFSWNKHNYTVIIKNGKDYKTKKDFVEIIHEKIKNKINLQKNISDKKTIDRLGKKQAKRRERIKKYYSSV